MMNWDDIANLDIDGKLAVVFRGVEEYHKEKKNCEVKCMSHEERLREVESSTKVYASMLTDMKSSMDRMEHRFYALTKTVFVMVGIGILGQVLVGLLTQDNKSNNEQESSSISRQEQGLASYPAVELLKENLY